jgi:branched-subunit amino acid transport protein
MNELIMIAGMALVTFTPRYGVLALLGRVDMPKPLFKALRFVPVAVLSAIIAPDLLLKEFSISIMPQNNFLVASIVSKNSIFFAPQNSFLVAGIIAALVSWRTKNLLLTIVVGMAAFLLWRGVS